MKNAPRFPQGKAVLIYKLPQAASPLSLEKMRWAEEQVDKVIRLEAHHQLAITVTNFDANPVTMKHWLNKACAEMFPNGNRYLSFQFRGTRRLGTLYIRMLYGRKRTKGKEITLIF